MVPHPAFANALSKGNWTSWGVLHSRWQSAAIEPSTETFQNIDPKSALASAAAALTLLSSNESGYAELVGQRLAQQALHGVSYYLSSAGTTHRYHISRRGLSRARFLEIPAPAGGGPTLLFAPSLFRRVNSLYIPSLAAIPPDSTVVGQRLKRGIHDYTGDAILIPPAALQEPKLEDVPLYQHELTHRRTLQSLQAGQPLPDYGLVTTTSAAATLPTSQTLYPYGAPFPAEFYSFDEPLAVLAELRAELAAYLAGENRVDGASDFTKKIALLARTGVAALSVRLELLARTDWENLDRTWYFHKSRHQNFAWACTEGTGYELCVPVLAARSVNGPDNFHHLYTNLKSAEAATPDQLLQIKRFESAAAKAQELGAAQQAEVWEAFPAATAPDSH